MDLQTLYDDLRRGKAALLIGPRALHDTAGVPMHDALLAYLKGGLSAGDYAFYTDDELFYFNNDTVKARAKNLLLSFYEQSTPDAKALQQLADLPFQVVISALPDAYIETALRQHCPELIADYYNKSEACKPLGSPSEYRPLYYQIFGSLKDRNSLILTHDDLFAYISSILGDKQPHTDFKNALREVSYFVFLGFKFEKWYVQMLLRLLDIQKQEAERIATTTGLTETTVGLVSQQFQMQFINEDIAGFVQQLHDYAAENGVLRSQKAASSKSVSLAAALEDLLIKGEWSELLQKMRDFFQTHQEDDLEEGIIMLSAKYNRWKRDEANGTLDNPNAELMRLTKSARSYINEIKALEK